MEAFVAIALWSAQWRRAAIVCGVVLHVGMILLLPAAIRMQLTIFAAESLVLYLLFLPRARILSSPASRE